MQKTVIFLSIVVLLALAAMGAYIWQNEQDKQSLVQQLTQLVASPTPTVAPTSPPTQQPAATTSGQTDGENINIQDANRGTITGSLSYPSEIIPDMKVCAENLSTQEVLCTEKRIQSNVFRYGVGYELIVPAGDYYVYAQRPENSYKAYYNEFVTCGLEVTCPSHTPITVSVQGGVTIPNIDPIDWYNQQ